ncbi:hypothetical protein CDL15_Pgr014953 [Punica granatum]|uniref:Myb/SANT-like domain-containing protein n=1 Tax=Punica granatum TaxID=22663 RepID=A0A218WZK4_PUNGR|nr:hypothetical protein CDL15_Pgr014953 [Punica granatum]PKI45563.1 hypothetical protein CRG98_034081 [Punica granatum]
MAPKGEGIVEWTNELESAFVDIIVDKFQRTHTSSWKLKDWEQISRELEEKFPSVILGADKVKTKAQKLKTQYTQLIELIQHTGVGWDGPTNTVKGSPDIWDKFIKRHSNFGTFWSKGCKHYEALKLMYKASTETWGLRISSTNPPQSPQSYARIEEEFLASRNSRGKEPIDLAEGSGDSDEPTQEAEEPIITGSRRRVRKRGSNNKSQLQKLIDLYKESKVKKDKAKNSTPLESKKSKSVTSPEKPVHNSIAEAMVVLNQIKGTISVREYLAGTARITKDDRWRQAFVCMYDEVRREWLHILVHP